MLSSKERIDVLTSLYYTMTGRYVNMSNHIHAVSIGVSAADPLVGVLSVVIGDDALVTKVRMPSELALRLTAEAEEQFIWGAAGQEIVSKLVMLFGGRDEETPLDFRKKVVGAMAASVAHTDPMTATELATRDNWNKARNNVPFVHGGNT